MSLCKTCRRPMQFEGGHHPPPGSAFEPWCATCADHPFVPAPVEDDEDGPLLVCERCERGVNLLLDGLCDACESAPAGEGVWGTARILMRAIEDIREPGARTYPVMVALANHESAIRAPLEAERDRLLEFKDAVDRETAIIGAKVENIAANSEALQWLLERTKARADDLEARNERLAWALHIIERGDHPHSSCSGDINGAAVCRAAHHGAIEIASKALFDNAVTPLTVEIAAPVNDVPTNERSRAADAGDPTSAGDPNA